MPRRRVATKREVFPDPKYNDRLLNRFISVMMRQGKKSLAESICYKAFDILQKKTGEDPLKIFKKAVDNAKPVLEVRSRRVGGSTYQVPIEVRPERRIALSVRWIIDFARKRSEKTIQQRLANELLEAYNNSGASIKKKEDTHKMAEANKAFAHYRW